MKERCRAGCPPASLQSLAGTRGWLPHVAARPPHSLDVGPRFVRAPRAGSGYSVPRSPSAVSTALGFSRQRLPPSPRGDGDAGPAFGSPSECPASWSRSPPGGGETALMGSGPLRHMLAGRIRLLPGVPCPGTFRPQGLTTLSAVYSPPCLATARQPPQRPWGSPFRALLLPTGGAPLGASPLLSFPPAGPKAGRPRLQRLSPAGEGARRAAEATAEPCPPGFRPFKAFPSDAFVAGFPAPSHLMPFRPEVLPTFLLPGGAPGDC
jgi:hypothetical protein